MKKSQVLAAIALAFALGLAPIASTFAVTVEPTATEKCNTTLAEAVEAVGGQTAWNNWAALRTQVAALEAVVDTSVTAQNDTGTNVGTLIGAIVTNTDLTADQVKLAIVGKDIYGVIAYAEGQIVADEGKKNALETAIDTAKDNIQAEIDKTVLAMQAISYSDVDGSLVNKRADVVIDAAKNFEGKYDAAKNLFDGYNAAYTVCVTNTGTASDTEKTAETNKLAALIAAFKDAAPAETPVTPDEPADEEKPTTPDTGVNTASEASATASVSILSGLASVATAAGVVIRKAFRK